MQPILSKPKLLNNKQQFKNILFSNIKLMIKKNDKIKDDLFEYIFF